ncbi:MAG: hypothetical protein Terrestrivirus8_37 [Terrestrivirus sp.]|uniref:Uncharacterized protein n=1 Tax=Terrestrivirus sp. TaxID=2487775 RepID=A0A3G4ZQE5_9VIRU|nr:MAG: hypothetical protein Terrestrivirus8_37 [Terrestrivirus sp.]
MTSVDYKTKYIKYKEKYLRLCRDTSFTNSKQIGGDTGIDNVKEIINEKGKHFWYNSSGKLLVNSSSDAKSKTAVLDIIKKEKSTYLNKNLINVKINIWKKGDAVPAPIGLIVSIMTVNEVNNKIALNIRDSTNSYIHIYLEPDQFNLSHIKKIAKAVLDKKLEDGEDYTYKDIKKYI